VVEKGYAGRLAFVQGRLDVGEALAPPLIRRVKEHADAHATVILDAPPGTACPVVETVKGSDFCLLVTEPTPFGLHDLALAFEVAQRIGVPCGVVLNRAGMGDEGVADYCRQKGIPLLLRLPFGREIAQAYARGLPLVEAQPRWRQEFARLAEVIRAILTGLRPGRAEPGE
jgi:MinD superfamily P-loop ATPase